MQASPVASTAAAPRPSTICRRVGRLAGRVVVDRAVGIVILPRCAAHVGGGLGHGDLEAPHADDAEELCRLAVADLGVDGGAHDPRRTGVTGGGHERLGRGDRRGGVEGHGAGMELPQVDGTGAGPGRLFGFGSRRLLGVEVATAVGHQAGQGQEHGHEHRRHSQELPVLAPVTTLRPVTPQSVAPCIHYCRLLEVRSGQTMRDVEFMKPSGRDRCEPSMWPKGSSIREAGDRHVGQAGDAGDGDRHRAAGNEVLRVGGDLRGRTRQPGAGQRARHRGRRLGLGVGRIALDHGRLHRGARRGLDVALGRVDPPEADHEDDNEQEHRGHDHQLGDGLALFPAPSPSFGQPLVRYSWMGALLVADTVRSSQGMMAWARPVTVTWATSPVTVVVVTAGAASVPGPVVAMNW